MIKLNRYFCLFYFLLITLTAFLSLNGCNQISPSSSSGSGGGSSGGGGVTSLGTKIFLAVNMTTDEYYQLTAQLLYSGAHCEIYVDNNSVKYVTSQQINNAGQEFDTNTFSLDTGIYGSGPDVDNNGKVTILIYNIPGGNLGTSYIAGFFDPQQEYSGYNGKDMLYMNIVPTISGTTPGVETFNQTIAHEFQHMINYYQRVMVKNYSEEDTWINEGLSVSAEGLYEISKGISPGLDDRVTYYNISKYNSLYIAQGTNFVSWADLYDNYVTDFLFFQWIRIQSGGTSTQINGTNILRTIRDNINPDYTAVVSAVNNNISVLSSADWKTILGDWFIANAICSNTGIYGYNGIISVKPTMYTHNSANLAPGCGVYLKNSLGMYSTNYSGNISFAGINTTNGVVYTNSSYTGNILLAYNYDGTTNGNSSTANGLPNANIVSDSKENINGVQSFDKVMLSGPFPVDFIVGRNGKNTLDQKSIKNQTSSRINQH